VFSGAEKRHDRRIIRRVVSRHRIVCGGTA
jgi:hypothetical protein